jgi:hypothetical protein
MVTFITNDNALVVGFTANSFYSHTFAGYNYLWSKVLDM